MKEEATMIRPKPKAHSPKSKAEGWHGWDDYAQFYDWENAQTLGRQDVAFWQRLARQARGPILELGSGTGRITVPVGRMANVRLVGVDRSDSMLAYARRRVRHGARRSVTALATEPTSSRACASTSARSR